jgi:hypothetical protein
MPSQGDLVMVDGTSWMPRAIRRYGAYRLTLMLPRFHRTMQKLGHQDLAILNERRAGNQGRANRREVRPISG